MIAEKENADGVYVRITSFLGWINSNVADGWCDGTNTTATTATSTSATPTNPIPTLLPQQQKPLI